MTSALNTQRVTTKRKWGIVPNLLKTASMKKKERQEALLMQRDIPRQDTTDIDFALGSHKLTLKPGKEDWEVRDTNRFQKAKEAKRKWREEYDEFLSKLDKEHKENKMHKRKIEILLDLLTAASVDAQVFEIALLQIKKQQLL